MIKIIIKLLLLIATIFGLSLLLDLTFIQSNWLRYSVIVITAGLLALIFVSWIIQDIKQLK